MAGLTPKQRVLRVFPEAHCYRWWGGAFQYVIYPGGVKVVRGKRTPWVFNNALNASDATPQQAWASAAYRLRV